MRLPLPGPFVTAPAGCAPRTCAPSTPGRQRAHARTHAPVWARPIPLAATLGFSFDFSSSGYLDVSVPPVCPPLRDRRPSPPGFPHSGTRGSAPECGSPRTIAASRALRRLPVPRHPPCALNTVLAIFDSLFQLAPRGEASRRRPAFALCGSQGARGAPRGPGAAAAEGTVRLVRSPLCSP